MAKKSKNNIERELRCYGTCKRSSEDSRMVEGTAVVFNSDSEDLGFIEQILPEAITEETIKRSDIMVTLNHSTDRGILGRSYYGRGSLQLWLDNEGLHYRFEAPSTTLGDELLSYLERGEIFGSSFAFSVDYDDPDAEQWVYDSEAGISRRFIKKIDRLWDVSPVFTPAYSATDVSKRKAEEMSGIMEHLNALEAEIQALGKVE